MASAQMAVRRRARALLPSDDLVVVVFTEHADTTTF
jgi:hypothetical protein